MTYEEVWAMLDSIGIPCTYRHWDETEGVPAPPFLIFVYEDRQDFLADDGIYSKIVTTTLELYSADKDFESEDAIEAVLEAHGIQYTKEEDYISTEKLFVETYTFDFLLEE